MTYRIHNFSAGPATLPLSVLEEAHKHFLDHHGIGMSILEVSHRSKHFTSVIEEAEANLRSLLGIPDDYWVLFLQGGASLQFSMVPMNFLRGSGKIADYIQTGSWGNKALKEAKKEGEVNLAWDGKPDNFVRTPSREELSLSSDAAYVHFTSNETIQGVQFSTEPDTTGIPLVCDMSSDFLSRPIEVSRYGLIYAGAQKNAGPAGATIVILRKDLLERIPENLPSLLDYRVHVEGVSLYNTPPVFSIYIVMLVTRWLKNEIGGLDKMEEINRKKAAVLYETIDGSGGFYRGHSQPECRSQMNVTWRLPSEDLEKDFIAKATAEGLDGLKGHRSVGGIRASIYNAMPSAGTLALANFMKDFQKRNG